MQRLHLCLIGLLTLPAAAQDLAQDPGKGREGANDAAARQRILKRFDANGDGKLDDSERAALKKAMQDAKKGQSGDDKKKKPADKPKDKPTEKPEGKRGAKGKPSAEILKRFDTNKDGKLDETERKAAREALGRGGEGRGGDGDGEGRRGRRKGPEGKGKGGEGKGGEGKGKGGKRRRGGERPADGPPKKRGGGGQ